MYISMYMYFVCTVKCKAYMISPWFHGEGKMFYFLIDLLLLEMYQF